MNEVDKGAQRRPQVPPARVGEERAADELALSGEVLAKLEAIGKTPA